MGPYNAAKLTYQQKAERLVAVYNQDPDYDVPDPVLYSLLNARAVQEFNGSAGWRPSARRGHPQGPGPAPAPEGGKVAGGTE